MDKLIITGPAHLSGEVEVSTSKNASLPILAATILCSEPIRLLKLPNLTDIKTMFKILESFGVKIFQEGDVTTFDSSQIKSVEATYEGVKTMRASIIVLGPLLSRFKRAKVSLPGGCAIGARPIDLHLMGLKKMGAHIELKEGYVEATCSESGLKGAQIDLPFPSVGATENLMLAAVYADGKTVISNAAMEPEVEDLGNFLKGMGVNIEGHGTPEIVIFGTKKLSGLTYQVISDRIEAATYLIAGIMTNSSFTIKNIYSRHLKSVLHLLKDIGGNFNINEVDNTLELLPRKNLTGFTIDTAPYPGIPTDVQAQLLVLATICESASVITEHIFENRFMHVPELNRMGAQIILKGHSAFIPGNVHLQNAPVMCTDLRASAALVLASLMAEGETEIGRIYHLDRGYAFLDQKLKDLGVLIKRIS
jgi:UDP-N-acetylglucosamine 1-carboxyvinyltransferase